MDLIGIELYLNLGTGSKYKNNLMIRNKRSVAFYFVNNLLYNYKFEVWFSVFCYSDPNTRDVSRLDKNGEKHEPIARVFLAFRKTS